MKKILPSYYQNFICIADKCPDTCCAGWEVTIDKHFQELYTNHPSDAAKIACNAMYTDKDGDVCLALINGRCPMLTDNNLCRLYIEIGKDALCDVCRIYPRFEKETCDATLCGISLSCPEAARLILGDKTNGNLNELPVYKNETSHAITETFNFLKNKSAEGVFFSACCLAEDIQSELDFGNTKVADELMATHPWNPFVPTAEEMLKSAQTIFSFEILTERWREKSSQLKTHLTKACTDKNYCKKRDAAFKEASQTNEIKNIQIYFLYKYLAEALEYADVYTLITTAWVCSAVICEIYAMEMLKSKGITFEQMVAVAQLFAKEAEHNEDNMQKLSDTQLLP